MYDMYDELSSYLFVSSLIFYIALLGMLLNRRSIIRLLLCLELLLLAVNINFIAFSAYFDDLIGQVCSLFVLTVVAAEAAVGLAIIMAFFRNRGSIAIDDVSSAAEGDGMDEPPRRQEAL